MLKGVQRKLIVLKTHQSDLFESAYFILRDTPSEHRLTQNEMLREATRILRENSHLGAQESTWRRAMLPLVLGFFLGVLTTGVIWLSLL